MYSDLGNRVEGDWGAVCGDGAGLKTENSQLITILRLMGAVRLRDGQAGSLMHIRRSPLNAGAGGSAEN